ncbi:ferredoxin [uncultured Roseobacter sp.]|uniref:ferredoxin n=1 Tax=uncultured Roseobacter sp. TaxID=114847 RepID=UPI0026340B8A|nr:ferredoxin [uncultured Roseobacter sp.]
MSWAALEAGARERHLTILGGFHPDTTDGAPDGYRTLLLLGPSAPEFWPAYSQSAEALDGAPDPMDRWSERVIGGWARSLGATALFPFGGPPWLPFFSWAQRTGRIHASPIMLLVHDEAGLFVSFRGALALREHIDLPPAPPSPCITCDTKPCKSACPVNAFDGTGYDVDACKSHLGQTAGADCMAAGCLARRACPVSVQHPRQPAQSAYHMQVFRG